MPLIILECKIKGKTPKGLGRQMPRITREALRDTAVFWHKTMLEKHFTPGNDGRYHFDPRNPVYMKEIKRKEGVSQGRYVKEILKGQSLRWMRTFVSVSATSHQANLRMTSPTYFEKPFIGSFVDPQSGKMKHVTRQPNKPREVTQVNDADKSGLRKYAQERVTMRVTQELHLKSQGFK